MKYFMSSYEHTFTAGQQLPPVPYALLTLRLSWVSAPAPFPDQEYLCHVYTDCGLHATKMCIATYLSINPRRIIRLVPTWWRQCRRWKRDDKSADSSSATVKTDINFFLCRHERRQIIIHCPVKGANWSSYQCSSGKCWPLTIVSIWLTNDIDYR